MKSINFFKRTILFFLLLANSFGYAQNTLIPDPTFEKALIDLGIDSGAIDGQVLTANINTLKKLELKAKGILDLTGIENFVNLEYLDLGVINNDATLNNKISNLDVSKNTKLKYLNCYYNNLTNLDVSKNTNLTELYVAGNQLNNIDISNNILLKNFDCSRNNFTALDVTKNTALQYLSFDRNKLTVIDVSKNVALINLICTYNELTSLDITSNLNLNILACEFNKLTNLDVRKNTIIKGIYCDVNQLASLDVSNNLSLESLTLNSNKVGLLDISKNTQLSILEAGNNQLSSIDVSKNLNLRSLNIGANPIPNLDVTKNSILEILGFTNTNIPTIDVSRNPKLIQLNCAYTLLTSLDVSKNSQLITIACNNNSLTSLNLKNGNNTLLYNKSFVNNSSLNCIQVDDETYSNNNWSSYKDSFANYATDCSKSVATTAPVLTATGDQLYCPLSSLKITTSFSIVNDPAEPGTKAAYIQISSGYSNGSDKLELSNPAAHPEVITSWDVTAGKLTISSPTTGADVLYSDLEAAIKDIVFSNSSATASGTRTFSITIGQANYLPSTQHFYSYIASIGITWIDAKAAAEISTYYGLKGYLATILSADEAKLIGEQASGTGWIGGSDAETEGVWKWVTGPEAGTIFWNGLANGSTPNFAFWNTGEPNNQGGNEKYAHITQPGVGIKGSWNDLSNTGDPSGDYQPKGYVVEYGGMPGETPLQIAASTKITIPVATALTPNPVCNSGSFTINATGTTGTTISWYDSAVGGTLLATGNSFTTPTINTTTTYYVDAGCESNRKSVVATVNITPTTPVATNANYSNCGPGTVTLQASTNVGFINWYTNLTGGTSLHTGNNFTTPTISTNTTYYAEASNNGCINPNRIPIAIEIHTPPVVTDENVALCQFQDVELDAGISGMTYMWNNGETTQTIIAKTGGTYTVDVTSPAPENCTSRKTIIVNEHQVPQIKKIDVNGTRVVIYLTIEEDYFEYSVDGINFQDSNVFYDVPGGLQTAYAREKSGCGGDSLEFIVLVFPPFFTPNNDSFNDLWEVTGMENYPQAQVTIFDRYGKFVAQLDASKMSWDGTLNKTPLPASDYWYALKIDDTKPILRGHFSLKR